MNDEIANITTSNVTPLRALGEDDALAWLRSQPGMRTNLPAAELARRWGWPRYKVTRWLQRWRKSGLVVQRGRALMAIDIEPVKAAAKAATERMQHVDVVTKPGSQLGRSVAVRNAARDAATVAAPESDYVTRLLMLYEPGTVIRPLSGEPGIPGLGIVPVPVAPRSGRFPDQTRPAPAPAAPVLRTVILGAALALASVSGWYSITGLTSIFIGAFWPVIAMGIALELGKLCAAAALPTLPWSPLKAALVALVAVLMGLNAVGCYGFLARAQIEHSVIGDAAIEAQEAQAQAKLDVQAGVVADLDERIGQIDAAVMTATLKGRAKGAMQIADDQRRNRADLVRERQREADTLAEMKAQAAGLSAHRRVAAAELGPVKYLAALVGVQDNEMLRWFVLLVACLLDPAAILLLLVASRGRRSCH